MDTVDILCRARTLYAAAPSHAPAGKNIEPGTRCIAYALVDGGDVGFDTSAEAALAEAANTHALVTWNATHSTAEVLAAFTRAIAAHGPAISVLARLDQETPAHAVN